MKRLTQVGLLALLALIGTVGALSGPRLAWAQIAEDPECGWTWA